jgi:hypothetical protein
MYKNDSEEKMKIGDEKNMYNMRMKNDGVFSNAMR